MPKSVEVDAGKANKFKARVARFLDKGRLELRCHSREGIRCLLNSVNDLGCSDAAIAKLLRVSRPAVSRWRSGPSFPSRENLARLEYLEGELRRMGPSHWYWPRAPESGRTPGGRLIQFKVQERSERMARVAMKLERLKWASGLP